MKTLNTYIPFGDHIKMVYDDGHWNVLYDGKLDTHGDMSRCLAAFPVIYKGYYDFQVYNNFKNAYVAAMKKLSHLKDISFDDKLSIAVASMIDYRDYYAQTNKNHFGIMLNYRYTTDHHLSKSDTSSEERTFANYAQVCQRIMDIEIGEFVKAKNNPSIYSIIDFIEKFSNHLKVEFDANLMKQ